MRTLKPFLLLIACLLVIQASASGTEITIAQKDIPNWQNADTAPRLRIYLNRSITTSDGKVLLAGSPMGPGGQNWYKVIICSVVSGAVRIPQSTLDSLTDALSVAGGGTVLDAKYSAYFYTSKGAQIKVYDGFASFTVPPTPNPTTWDKLHQFNNTTLSARDWRTYTASQIDALIAGVSAGGSVAGEAFVTRTSSTTLTNETALNSLGGPGLVKMDANGNPARATAGTDFENALTFNAPLIRSTNTIDCRTATTSLSGCVSAADWTTFNAKQAALGFTPENAANKNAASGYAGLTALTKLNLAHGQEVWGISDLTDYANKQGTGTTALGATFTALALNDTIKWDGTNWVNTPLLAGSGTVTSVAMSVPAFLSVSGSPITTTGTLAVTLSGTAVPIANGGTNSIAALNNNRMMLSSGGAIVEGGALTNGQFFVGQTGGAPIAGTVRSANANIVVTLAAGDILLTGADAPAHALLSHSDTTSASPSRGDVITRQGTGAGAWARLALGAANRYLSSDGTDAVYAQVSLSAGVTGTLTRANGGTGQSAAPTDGQLLIGKTSTGTWEIGTITAGPNIQVTPTAGGVTIEGTGTVGTAKSSITSQTANWSISNGAFTAIETWGNATGTADLLTYRDTASNTGTGHIVLIHSNTSSAAKPVAICAGGTTNCVEMSSAGNFSAIGTALNTANALAGVDGNGAIGRTAAGNFEARTFTDAAGIAWTNGDLVSGNPSAQWSPATFVASFTLWDSANASRTLTAGLSGATDPVITFSNTSIDVTTGTLKEGGSPVVKESRTLTAGVGLTGGGTLAADRTFTVDQGFSPDWVGVHNYTPNARSSGVAPYFKITAPGDTGLTADTEAIGVSFVGATRTHADGTTQATQREFVFGAPTYAAAGTSTITNSATVAIPDAPAAGSNMTLTNRYALWVQAGDALFAGLIRAGTGPTTLTDAAGKLLSAALNTVGVPQGGSGAVTLTGLVQGNGTSAFTAIANSTTVGQTLRVTGSNTYGWGALDLADGDAITGLLPDANIAATLTRDSEWPSATATLTEKTLDVEASGNVVTTISKVLFDGASCNGATATANFDLPTASAPTSSCTGTTTTVGTLDFADASTTGAMRQIRLPSDWTGALDVALVWLANSASTNAVRWQVSCGCVADSEAVSTGPSYNASSASNTAYTGTANQRKTTTFTTVAVTNCAAGETMWLKVERVGADAGDTLAATARLLQVEATIRRAQ